MQLSKKNIIICSLLCEWDNLMILIIWKSLKIFEFVNTISYLILNLLHFWITDLSMSISFFSFYKSKTSNWWKISYFWFHFHEWNNVIYEIICDKKISSQFVYIQKSCDNDSCLDKKYLKCVKLLMVNDFIRIKKASY